MNKLDGAQMTAEHKDASDLWRLRSMHDSAIRGYYTYELLNKLLTSQERSPLQEISTPLGIASSVLAIFAFLQLPASRNLILVAYGIVIVVVAGGPIAERKLRKRNGLDDVVYLGIHLDEAAKYLNEIVLSKSYDRSEAVEDFVEDTKDALLGTLPFLREKIKTLKDRKEYPDCLGDMGRSEKWLTKLDQDIRSVLGSGIFG